MTGRWPAHPRPRDGESLTSWFARTARANGASPAAWFAFIHGRFHSAVDLDMREDGRLWDVLSERTGHGDAAAIRAMTLLDVSRRLGPRAAGRWVLSASRRASRPKARWCPRCLAQDDAPYLRRCWRLEWVLWCPNDGVRLRDACPTCAAPLDLRQLHWRAPFASCWRCGEGLARGSACDESAEPAVVRDATREALVALDTPSCDFGAVWGLQRWIERLKPAGRVELLRALNVPAEPVAADAHERNALTFALAWRLASWPDLADVTRRFQVTFNAATRRLCPVSLAGLRQPSDSAARRRDRIRARVFATAERLRAQGAPATVDRVAFEAGVSLETIHHLERSVGEIATGAENVALKVDDAIEALRQRGAAVTVSGVRRELVRRGVAPEARVLRSLVYRARETALRPTGP